ncbi:FadR/GntR family transcriptional regulator [Nocardia sp. CA-120079]|uniref:FadR/GntR family transcriptional regulator n=1 Tax=Nocardia sp. CA-120079 TaxID=3239974 RepID=UPI003D9805EA
MNKEPVRQQPIIRPVRRAYEQVADQMRQWILTGVITVGERLPPESVLAERFKTSRGTIREALRLLASENLILTRPGTGGGSIISRPDPNRITDSLMMSLTLLVSVSELSPGELVQARELMEIPAASLAAANRDEDHLTRLATLLPDRPDEMDPDDLFEVDRAFHETLLHASANRLLPLIASPIYEVNARLVKRNRVPTELWQVVVDQHREIFRAVRAGDSAAAALAMSRHLQDLPPIYNLVDDVAPSAAASDSPRGTRR